MGNLGKILAGGGCLVWLLAFVLGLAISFGTGIIGSIIGYEYASYIGYLGNGSCCCSSLGFLSFVVGVVMILVGGNSAPAPD